MFEITSPSNERFKYFKSLSSKKARTENGEYIVEGIKSVNDALSSNREITAVIACEDVLSEINIKDGVPLYVIPKRLAEKLTDTKTPQGVFAVLKIESKKFLSKENGLYVYCDTISDPGNLGTIIRTADSAGFDGVLLSEGCVDVYNPKTVRSCMGSFFHIDIITDIDEAELISFKEKGGKLYGGILSGETEDYREPSYDGNIIITVGNEANGISEKIKKLCNPIKIPIYGKAESLNAAVAASIMMYEAANKRRGK